jgi:hypothetical protein
MNEPMTTPAVPPQAIDAAVQAALTYGYPPGSTPAVAYSAGSLNAYVTAILEAAAPAILTEAVAAERERIRQMALLRGAFYEDAAGYWDFADLIGGDST